MILLETERLRLRRPELRDAARFAEYRSDADVARYQSWDTMTVEEAEAFIRALPREFLQQCDEWSQIAIADKTTDEVIGDIGVCKRAPGTVVEFGVTLSPAAQRGGLATEACRAVVEWIFSFPGVVMVEAVVDDRNTRAIALVERLGMSLDRYETAEFKGAACREAHFVLRR